MKPRQPIFDATRATTQSGVVNEMTVAEQRPHFPFDNAASEWRVGDFVLGTYQIKRVHDGGAMGRVYRVYHGDWNRHLAVKSPKPSYFQSEVQKQNFVRECLAWIGLGVHPHIVTCHYVRTIGGIPRVFAEYMEGGTLRDSIRSRRLYQGSGQERLSRILDLSIQFAWGLEFSHSKGLIHQDVKPANVLLTPEGVAKVSDFGLSNARAGVDENVSQLSSLTLEASRGGMTPAYCSPEQAANHRLTSQTDIWSWATSMLEMLVGSIQWEFGYQADTVLEKYLSRCYNEAVITEIPDALSRLLKACLERDLPKRASSFAEVILGLKGIFQVITGKKYIRSEPKPVEGLADVLNNQALSLLELGLKDEAMRRFDAALEADSHHPECTYNRGLNLWREGTITDADVIERVNETRKVHRSGGRVPYLLGMIHLERADVDSALNCFVEAQNQGGGLVVARAIAQARELQPHVPQTSVLEAERKSIAHVCANIDGRFVLAAYEDKTVGFWDTHLKRCLRVLDGHKELASSSEHLYSSVSVALNADGRFALTSCSKTIRLWDTSTGTCKWEYEDSEQIESASLSGDGLFALWEGGSKIASETEPGAAFRLFCLFDIKRQKPILRIQRGLLDLGVALSPDSKRVLSGFSNADGKNGGLILWDVASGQEVCRFLPVESAATTFRGHTNFIRTVAFSADGSLVLSASSENTVRVWEINTGKQLGAFTGNHSHVVPGSYGSNGQILILGDHIQRWDHNIRRCLRTFDNISWNRSSNAVALSGDGRVVITGGDNGTITISDAGKPLWNCLTAEFMFVQNMTTAETLSNETMFETWLASARDLAHEAESDIANALVLVRRVRELPGHIKDNRAIELWGALGAKCVRRSLSDAWQWKLLKGHTGFISSLALTRDSKFLLSAADDHSIRVWDTNTGECVRVLDGHDGPVNSIAVSDDGSWAVSASGFPVGNVKDNSLRLWDLRSGNCIRTIEAGPLMVKSAAFGANARLLISGDGSLPDELTKNLLFERNAEGQLLHNRSSRDKDVSLRFWDATTGRCLRVLSDHRLAITALGVSADSRLAISGSLDRTVRLWDIRSGQCVRKIDVEAWVNCVALDVNTRSAFFQATDSAVVRFDLDEDRILRTFDGHGDGPKAIALSECGKFMLVGAADNKLHLWDVEAGSELVVLEGHSGSIDAVALSKDARLAASGGADGTVGLWRLDWEYDFPGWSDWDENARPFLRTFLRQRRCRVSGSFRRLFGSVIFEANQRISERDFEDLLMTLSFAGYGWLRSVGVRRELEKMNAPPRLLLDFLKKPTASDRLSKISKPRLIARIGEEEHPAQQVRNADGGRMVEDWSEGKSGAIWTGRFVERGTEILSSGKPGFQLWDGRTGRLKTTIQMPNFDSAGVILESIDISRDYNSFASYGRRSRPNTKFHDYVAWFHGRGTIRNPIELPPLNKNEYFFNGIRFLPQPNRIVRSSPHLLEMIDTERNQVIDSLTFKGHINMRLSEDGARVFVGWDKGVAVIDCSSDKLSRVCDLDLPPSLFHFGIVDKAGDTLFVSSRSEGEQTGAYCGRISAWNISSKKPLWLIETASLNTLWRDVTSLALHPNGGTLACCVTEKELVVGKKHSSASYVLLVNASDGTVREHFKAHRNYAGPVAFSADASRLLTVSSGESAMKLWAL